MFDGTNVGIGTASPGYKLDVRGTIFSSGSFGNRGVDDAYRIKFYDNGGVANDAGIGLDGSAGSEEMWFNSLNGFYWATGTNGEKMRITQGGNVGIGTTTPTLGTLQVNGNVYATSFTGSLLGTASYATQALSSSYAVTASYALTAGSTTAVTGTTNYVSKFTSATAIGNSQIFDDGTNVGIGTASPSAKLTVVGDGSGVALIGSAGFGSNYTGLSLNGTLNTSAYNLLSSPTDTHLYINRPSGKDIYFRMANNDQVAITSAGLVGIGTTSPTLISNYKSLTLDATDGTFTEYRQGGTALFRVGADTSRPFFYGMTNAAMDFYTNTTLRMTIAAAGNVGIGTASPNAKLHIAAAALGTSTNDYVLNSIHYNSNGNSEELEIKSVRESAGSDWTYGGKRIQLRIDSTYMGYMQFNGYGNQAGISFGTGTTVTAPGNVTERMRITSIGTVGIGTTSPASVYRLTIDGAGTSGNPLGGITFRQGGTDTLYFGNISTANTTDWEMWNPRNGYMRFATNNVERMRIASNGAIQFNAYGSGTFTGTVAYNLAVDSSGNVIETAGGVVDGSGTANYIPKWQDANTLTNSVIYETSSNIGIGTTTPGAKLEVVGSFRATTKSFIIDHPTKEGKKLQYGVLEGPEHSVYVRGKLTNTNVIQLPDYWHALVDENSITVNLTAIGRKQELWVEEITDTYITVGSEAGIINCFYTVFAERKDVEKLVTEFDKE